MFKLHVMMTMALVVLGMMAVGVRGAYDEPDWGFQFRVGEPGPLFCNHSSLIAENGNFVVWELPDGTKLTQDTDRFDMYTWSNVDNMQMTIVKVQESDRGVYVCHVYTSRNLQTKRGQLLRGVNMGGPEYKDTFEKYRDNLMVGGIAALVLFIPLVTMCFVYKYRYQTKQERREKHEARMEHTKHQRHLENNGKGEELTQVAVGGRKGASNEGYIDGADEWGTKL